MGLRSAITFFTLLYLPIAAAAGSEMPADSENPDAVVLVRPDDPYYALAEEIAATESLRIAETIDAATALKPVFLLWVISPARFSDRLAVELGSRVRDIDSVISIGIISGSTIDEARALWKRAPKSGGKVYAVNQASPTARIMEDRIVSFGNGERNIEPLTRDNFIEALTSACYLTFTGHGGTGYWGMDGRNQFVTSDIPDLPPVVVSSGGCHTFRIHRSNSIALRFTDRGAAAYSGFAFTPNGGYMIGQYEGLPFRYSWPDFPIGHLVQVQGRGAVQGFARVPHLFLLGDPRISFRKTPPYDMVDDRTDGGARIITIAGAPAGFIPVVIPDGAKFDYIDIPGVTSAWEHDLFYNSRLQMITIKDNKYVLFEHEGGDISLLFYHHPPWHWRFTDPLLDALDNAIVFSPQTGMTVIALCFTCVILIIIVVRFLRKKLHVRSILTSLLGSLPLSVLCMMYGLIRMDDVTVTSKAVEFDPWFPFVVLLLAASALFVYLGTRSRILKAIAVMIAAFPFWAAVGFTFAAVSAFNIYAARRGIDGGIFNYAITLMFLITFAVYCFLVVLVFGAVDKLMSRYKQ